MKLGIALGGGGAKGYAHIGVLEALTAAGFDFQIVTGTSAGALVGASYAANSLDKLKSLACEIKLTDIPLLLSPSWSMEGLFSGKNVLENLRLTLGVKHFEELSRVFGSTAVDLFSGELMEFTSGELETALRASFAIPGLFTPVTSGERLLVDGGISEVLPVELCRRLGADKVIAIDLYGSTEKTPLDLHAKKERNPIQSALSFLSEKILDRQSKRMNLIKIIEATISVIQKNITSLRLATHPADFVIQPKVRDVGTLDFHRAEVVIQLGRMAALEAVPQLGAFRG